MKLSFATSIDDKPTYFLEKIWKGLLLNRTDLETFYMDYQRRHLNKFGAFWDGDNFTEFLNPKFHSIRKDLKKEWKQGTEIQLVINFNEQNEFAFAPTIKCQSIQNIHIDYSKTVTDAPAIFVDYQLLNASDTLEFAVNDGFLNTEDLFRYFKEDFQGTLIHWTDLRY
jgi:hypothetical protein